MANVFGILTAIVLALTAFIAHQNSDRYKNEISERKKSEETRDATDKRDKQAHTDLDDTTAKRKATEETVSKLTRDRIALEGSNVKLTDEKGTKTSQSEAQKKQLDEVQAQLEGIGNVDTLVATIKKLLSESEGLTQTIATSKSTLANLVSEAEKTEKVNENFRTVSGFYAAKKSNPALKTRLTAIYPNWGFVTLGAGNSNGVVTNSTLDVVRGGETIAKLLVTAAEGSTASATIVPDSQKADTVLMVGDSVVPTK